MIVQLVTGLFFGLLCDGRLVSTCDKDEFPCDDGSCVNKMYWCDSEAHCKDHSDEKYCFQRSNLRPAPNKCDETYFVCKNGPCIPLVGLCDGYASCRDGSDEEGCPTKTSEVTNFTESLSSIDLNYTVGLLESTYLKESTTKELVPVEAKDDDINYFQSDEGTSGKDKDLKKGFIDIDSNRFRQQRSLAQQWLLSVRDQNFGWGSETPRALMALYASDSVSSREDELLMSKQLHVQLFTALMRNLTAPIPLWDLSLFINALSASCDDPKNFYGHDLVNILRQRVDKAETSSSFVTPLVYLTLCLNGATSHKDPVKLGEILKYTTKISKIDTEALVSLSATCISKLPTFSNHPWMKEVTTRLYLKVLQHGLPKNIYQLALVTQALNEARINQNKWNRSEALDMISAHQRSNGSFGDILSTYYVMPLLSGRSLLSLGHRCVSSRDKDLTPLEILKNGDAKKIYIQYSLYYKDPVEIRQTIMMTVKNMTSLLDIMRMAGEINPVYKFRYDMIDGKPEVYSIGGIVNDPESGLYWKLHVASNHETNGSSLLPYEGDIKNFKPKDGTNIVYWIKSLY